MEKKTVYVVLRGFEVIPELTAKSEREAWSKLGRWMVPLDYAIEGMTLTDLGRQLCSGANPFRVQPAEITW